MPSRNDDIVVGMRDKKCDGNQKTELSIPIFAAIPLFLLSTLISVKNFTIFVGVLLFFVLCILHFSFEPFIFRFMGITGDKNCGIEYE